MFGVVRHQQGIIRAGLRVAVLVDIWNVLYPLGVEVNGDIGLGSQVLDALPVGIGHCTIGRRCPPHERVASAGEVVSRECLGSLVVGETLVVHRARRVVAVLVEADAVGICRPVGVERQQVGVGQVSTAEFVNLIAVGRCSPAVEGVARAGKACRCQGEVDARALRLRCYAARAAVGIVTHGVGGPERLFVETGDIVAGNGTRIIDCRTVRKTPAASNGQ